MAASSPLNNGTGLTVSIDNVEVSGNTAIDALIATGLSSTVQVSNSVFQDNYSTGRGSIFYAENRNSSVFVSDSTFDRNYAYFGGVFFSQLDGFTSCTNCQITNNFAIQGGVLYS